MKNLKLHILAAMCIAMNLMDQVFADTTKKTTTTDDAAKKKAEEAAKKGLGTVAIVLIVVGVLCCIGLSCCIFLCYCGGKAMLGMVEDAPPMGEHHSEGGDMEAKRTTHVTPLL